MNSRAAPSEILLVQSGSMPRQVAAGLLSLASLFAASVGLADIAHAAAGTACKPTFAFRNVHFSAMRPPTFERWWTAEVSVDASRCATRSGDFAIGFSRLKEFGPETDFREKLVWAAPSANVSVALWGDEAVEDYWIDSVQTCPCAH
jgi:hypothetical protein